jgi:hypothetical protein
MEITLKQEITQEVTIRKKCDVCEDLEENYDDLHHFSYSYRYSENDSTFLKKYYDVCSTDCYLIKTEECLNDYLKEKRLEVKIDGFNPSFLFGILYRIKMNKGE